MLIKPNSVRKTRPNPAQCFSDVVMQPQTLEMHLIGKTFTILASLLTRSSVHATPINRPSPLCEVNQVFTAVAKEASSTKHSLQR